MDVDEFKKDRAERQSWISLLGSADKPRLQQAWDEIRPKVTHTLVSGPETGLVMVRAREDGEGPRFNLGEMTVSKCVLKVDDTYLGYGMVMGSDLKHAKLAALLDGLCQHPGFGPALKAGLLKDLSQQREEQEAAMAEEASRTRVEFFTLKRGE